MGRLMLLIVAGLAVVGLLGTLALGMFPPGPRTEQVQRVLPNDRFPQR